MTLTKEHKIGLSLSAGGILSYAVLVLQWAQAHVTVAGNSLTISGLPLWLTSTVTTSLAAIGTILVLLGTLRLLFSPRADGSDELKQAAKAVLPIAFALSLVGIVQACTPAQEAKFAQVENDILAGLRNGETLGQIEQQVAVDLGFAGPVNTIVVTLVVDTIDALVAMGVIPPNLVPVAQKMEHEEAVKLIKLGGHLPQAMLHRHGDPPEYVLAYTLGQP